MKKRSTISPDLRRDWRRLAEAVRSTGLKASIAAAIACAAFVPGANADFEAGWQAYQRGDFLTAYNEWQPLALQGDARAQFNIGVTYIAVGEESRGIEELLVALDMGYPIDLFRVGDVPEVARADSRVVAKLAELDK